MSGILFVVIGVIVVILYSMYAGIIKKKNKALESLSDIDVQLKKRSDLIPNILTIAKKYMEHEKDVLTQVTQMRAKADAPYDKNNVASVQEHLNNVGALDQSMGKLMISVEAYPTLKADETMLQAQRTYNEVEEHIAAARRFYNASVTELNNAVEIFPGSLLAPMAGAKIMPFYAADEASKAPVDASKFL